MNWKQAVASGTLRGAAMMAAVVMGVLVAGDIALVAQAPAQTPQRGRPAAAGAPDAGAAPAPPQAGRGGLVAYPDRPKASEEAIARGKASYSVNCAFCHGSDAGGGSIGPNLHRSEVVLKDQHGELIMPIVHGSRVDRGMPKIDISDAQTSDIADWLHSYKITSRGGHEETINIVVGDAAVGKSAFNKNCGSCHSVTGDLKGFAAKYTDPRAMQQAWIMPSGAGGRPGGGPGGGGAAAVQLKVPPVTATVTLADGKKVDGLLDAIDDFYVEVTSTDGVTHSYSRWNGLPKVDIHDPLAAHRELLRKYDDKDIHDITAYLQSLK